MSTVTDLPDGDVQDDAGFVEVDLERQVDLVGRYLRDVPRRSTTAEPLAVGDRVTVITTGHARSVGYVRSAVVETAKEDTCTVSGSPVPFKRWKRNHQWFTPRQAHQLIFDGGAYGDWLQLHPSENGHGTSMRRPAKAGEDMSKSEAQQLVGRVKGALRLIIPDVIRLYKGRAWLVLGYPSWDALCDAEFGGVKFPVDERRDAVKELSDAGMSNRAIGKATNQSHVNVARDLKAVEETQTGTSVPAADGSPTPTPTPAKKVGQDGVARRPRTPSTRNPAKVRARERDRVARAIAELEAAVAAMSGIVGTDDNKKGSDALAWFDASGARITEVGKALKAKKAEKFLAAAS